jgi:dGTP triphosphohydrolase
MASLLDDDTGDLAAVKAIATKRIYSSPLVLTNEATGYKVITGLLDAHRRLTRPIEIRNDSRRSSRRRRRYQ